MSNKGITFRVSENERALIEANAKCAGKSISEYVRTTVLKMKPTSLYPLNHFTRQLCNHNNLVERIGLSNEQKKVLHHWEEQTWLSLK